MSYPFRSSPVLWLLLGGLLAVVLVRRFFHPAYLGVLLVGSLSLLTVSLVLLFGRTTVPGLLLVSIGFSGFLVYGSFISYSVRVERQWLLNRRLTIRATWKPPNRLEVNRVNGDPYRTQLYFRPGTSRRELDQYKRDGSISLNATGRVDWYGVGNSFRHYLSNNEFRGLFRLTRLHGLEVKSGEQGHGLDQLRGMIQGYLAGLRSRAPTSVAMLQALILGEKEFSNRLALSLRRLGLYHLFVISGLHVGIIACCFWSLLQGLPVFSRGILAGLVLIVYVGFLGWPIPATRALVMLLIIGIGSYLDRRISLFHVLCVTVLFFMLVNPFVVFEPGFQLSVGAVAGIVLVQPTARRVSSRWWIRMALISLGAYCGVLPVLLYHFGYVSPLGLPGSFIGSLVFPALVALLTVQLLLLSVGWTVPSRWVEELLHQGVKVVSEVLSSWPMILEFPEVTVPTITVIVVILGFSLWPRTGTLTRFCLIGVLAGGLLIGQAAESKPSLVLHKTGREASVFVTTEKGEHGLFLPTGARLDTYTFYSRVRRLKSMGIHHLDFFVGDYSREMLRRVDPPVTIGTVVTSWRRPSGASWDNIRFGPDYSTLSTGTFDIHFRGRTPGGVPIRSNALGAVTSTGKCLIVNSSVLSGDAFQQLRASDCELLFLEDAPVRFDLEGRLLGRNFNEGISFAERIVTNVLSGQLLTGAED